MRSLLLIFLTTARVSASELATPADARQLVVVATRAWDSDSGTLRRFARSAEDQPWRAVGRVVPVNVGRAGMAWGLGLHTTPTGGPQKAEGDGKAPAGVFRLTTAFGYDAKPAGVTLPYIRARVGVEAVDDPHSRYYNRIVDRARLAKPDWHSSEKMLLPCDDYRFGVVVAHNPRCKLGAGSCIFLHVWRGAGGGTAGCTAMPVGDIAELQRWLDPRAHPLLMQAPRGFLPVALR